MRATLVARLPSSQEQHWNYCTVEMSNVPNLLVVTALGTSTDGSSLVNATVPDTHPPTNPHDDMHARAHLMTLLHVGSQALVAVFATAVSSL
eukprot:m.1460652 g.1460652  ORF g.1460652 m.1460652 type:complete len:92 (+) comp25129_c0_seq30:65-340(+)